VQPNGPAALAGLRPGDVVVELAGTPVQSPEDLRWRASLSAIGREVSLVVMRAGKRVPLVVSPVTMASQ
jgi:S1-C subfamily serine protease